MKLMAQKWMMIMSNANSRANLPGAGDPTCHDQACMADLSLAAFFDYCQKRILHVTEDCLAQKERFAPRLLAAMRYAMLNGGKRLRPALAYATFEAINSPRAAVENTESVATDVMLPAQPIDDVALALELLHGYSLVHDDLPAMDDDDLRRGKPTCHRAFDEATAILAGDALQCLAFEVLAGPSIMPPAWAAKRLTLIRILANASGTSGMAAGQALDLAATGRGQASAPTLDLPAIKQIHRLKTGCLLEASIEMAASVANVVVSDADLARLKAFGQHIGLAFQVQDDILDETGDTARLGKQAGADQALAKATYPAIMGLAGAKTYVDELLAAALAELSALSFPAKRLAEIAHFIVTRDH